MLLDVVVTLGGAVIVTLGGATFVTLGIRVLSDRLDVLYFVLCQCWDSAADLREESICSEQCFIVLRDDQYLAVAQIETPSVSKPKPPCSWDIETETTVVFGGWSNVVAIGGMGHPQ